MYKEFIPKFEIIRISNTGVSNYKKKKKNSRWPRLASGIEHVPESKTDNWRFRFLTLCCSDSPRAIPNKPDRDETGYSNIFARDKRKEVFEDCRNFPVWLRVTQSQQPKTSKKRRWEQLKLFYTRETNPWNFIEWIFFFPAINHPDISRI